MCRYLLTPTILEQMKSLVHEVTKIVAGLEQGKKCEDLLSPAILEQMKHMVLEVTKMAAGLEQG
jgi:hypothetical protein